MRYAAYSSQVEKCSIEEHWFRSPTPIVTQDLTQPLSVCKQLTHLSTCTHNDLRRAAGLRGPFYCGRACYQVACQGINEKDLHKADCRICVKQINRPEWFRKLFQTRRGAPPLFFCCGLSYRSRDLGRLRSNSSKQLDRFGDQRRTKTDLGTFVYTGDPCCASC